VGLVKNDLTKEIPMSIIKTLSAVAGALILSFASTVNAAPDTETDANDVILAGHDAVAYFTESKAVVGSAEYTTVYNSAIYRFISAQNRNQFQANPEKYAPVYGGFCAYGMSFGKKFEIDGKAFEIVDGKLYVNKNLDVKKAWMEDVPKHIAEADEAWPSVKNTPADQL
jgi:YHS domain-containing protein